MKILPTVIYVALATLTCAGSVNAAPNREAQSHPKVFLMDGKRLLQTKRRIAAGDASLRSALSKLLKDAESALDDGPFSVMDKTLTPPSGDKHDFMSFGPYWWPDPKKKDGLPYIRRDGEVNPASRADGSDFPRLKRMTIAAETLALAYYFSGNDKYAGRAALLLRTWFLNPDTRMNPHLKYGQAIPGRVEGRGIGIIDTRRLTKVVDAAGLLAGSPAWTDNDKKALKEWFEHYVNWLQTSKHGKNEDRTTNNHGTWYDVQVADFAMFVGNTALAREVLESAKTKRIAAHIRSDGGQPHELDRTRSFDYCTMNLAGMFSLARLGEHVGVDLWRFTTPDKRGIRAALDYVAPYADPTNKWPFRQITELRRSLLLPLFQQAAIVYGQPEYREMTAHFPEQDVRSHRCQLLYPVPAAQPERKGIRNH